MTETGGAESPQGSVTCSAATMRETLTDEAQEFLIIRYGIKTLTAYGEDDFIDETAHELGALSGDAESSQPGSERPLDAHGTTLLRGGIGAVLFLCLTRWDLLFDLVLLQTLVTKATVQQFKDCNAIIHRSQRNTLQGLVLHPSHGQRRKLSASADSSHASKKSSYAFEGNLVLLQSENSVEPRRTSEHQSTVPASHVPGISGYVHPLHVS